MAGPLHQPRLKPGLLVSMRYYTMPFIAYKKCHVRGFNTNKSTIMASHTIRGFDAHNRILEPISCIDLRSIMQPLPTPMKP